MKKRLSRYGLTSVQHLVLSTLWLDGGSTAVALGKQLVLDKATLSGIIDRLSESKWIYKKKDEQDNRVYRLYLTDKARQLMPTLVDLMVRFDADLLTDLNMEEKVILKRLLRDLI
ncbi:MAG: MarR family transcriptional regulator [Deltaproteobacteria bacterium]|nr:MarR family transcriptional regulator [Deltaproteobacteria bacterium]